MNDPPFDPRILDPVALTVDVAIFTLRQGEIEVLVIRRAEAPFRGAWALPGGFVRSHEELAQAAGRVLEEETGARGVFLEQLSTFGSPNRDPRMRVVSVAYYVLLSHHRLQVHAGLRTLEAAWVPARNPPHPLAFDHQEILAAAVARIRAKFEYSPIALEFLPQTFTLTDLQRVYETVIGQPLDKRNFRLKVLKAGLVRRASGTARGPHPPAALYTAGPGAGNESIYPPFRWKT